MKAVDLSTIRLTGGKFGGYTTFVDKSTNRRGYGKYI